MRVLVTGAAGFIGFHTVNALIDRGEQVIGFDNLSPYYDVRLKETRLERLLGRDGFGPVVAVGQELSERPLSRSARFRTVPVGGVVRCRASRSACTRRFVPHSRVRWSRWRRPVRRSRPG